MMNTLGLALKQWSSFLNKASFEEGNIVENTPKRQMVYEKKPAIQNKMAISLQDLEYISEALLFYSKHLAKQQRYEKMEKVKDLDQRIFQILENMKAAEA